MREARGRVSESKPEWEEASSGNALVSGHGSASDFGEDAAATARDNTEDSKSARGVHRDQGKRSRTHV